MILRVVVIIFIVLFCGAGQTGAQTPLAGGIEPGRLSIVRAVLDSLIDCRYTAAHGVIDSLIQKDSADPLLPLVRLCAIGLRDLDYDTITDSTLFERAFEKIERQWQDGLFSGLDSAFALTLRGYARAIYAAFCLRMERYGAAVRIGLDGLDLLQEARAQGPHNADADLFLGLYECVRAELRKKLWWVLFWYPGDYKEGIARLENCMRHGRFAGSGAAMVLADMYIPHLPAVRTLAFIDSLQSVYPHSRFLLWSKARYYTHHQKPGQAAHVYGRLFKEYRHLDGASHNAAYTALAGAEAFVEAGKQAQARELATALVAMQTPGSDAYINKKVRKARSLLEKMTPHGKD